MKTELEVVDQRGTIDQTNAIECTFDPEGTAHLMSILTNIYSDAPLAVLREYSTNAYDSHVEAGNPNPIEVYLPSYLAPTLKIKDYGTGLTEEEILNIYSRYGASTKRNTNSQMGTFGIGSKAAFTIGQQFIVTGVKNKKKTSALFALNKQGVGTVNILSREETNEPNGVEISIGINDSSLINTTADRFFKTWKPGTVLVNSKSPQSILDGSYEVTDKIHVINKQGYSGIWVSMGSVAYPVSKAIIDKLKPGAILPHRFRKYKDQLSFERNTGIYLTVDIGDVDITPSREGLRDTDKTVNKVSEMFAIFVQTAESKINAELQTKASLKEAAQFIKGVDKTFGPLSVSGEEMSWKNQKMDEWAAIDLPYAKKYPYSSKLRKGAYVNRFTPLNFDWDCVVITDIPQDHSKYAFNRLSRWMNQKDIEFVLFANDKQNKINWFSYGPNGTVNSISFADYQEEAKKAPSLTGNVRSETKYKVYGVVDRYSQYLPVTEINKLSKQIFYFDGEPKLGIFHDELLKEGLIVCYERQQTERGLLKRFPAAKDGNTRVREIATDFYNSIPQNEKEALTVGLQGDHWHNQYAKFFNKFSYRPKMIQDFIRLYDETNDYRNKNPELLKKYRDAVRLSGKEHIKVSGPQEIFKKYPLLEYFGRDANGHIPEHLSIYLKAVDQSSQTLMTGV